MTSTAKPELNAGKLSWQTLLDRPILATLLATCAILFILQCWRPYFFLTDDNLNNSPVLIEAGRNLIAGKNPYVSQYLYEGNLLVLREASVLSFCHPVLILISGLLSLTPWQHVVIDLIFSIYYLMAAGFSTLLYLRLRERYKISISNGLVIIISLSSTFSIWSLILSSSAGMYVCNQYTLSLIFIGLINPSWKYGSMWVGFAVANAFLSSHAGELVFTLFFVILFVIAFCYAERTLLPAIILVMGGLLTIILISPYLPSVIGGVLESRRAAALTTNEIITQNFPFPSSLISYFICFLCAIFGQTFYENSALNHLLCLSFPCCFGAWLIFICRMPLKKIRPIAWCFIGFAAFALLIVDRPVWLQEYFLQFIPLVRSLRWPFKELMFFIFFIHLWMIIVPPVGNVMDQTGLLFVGCFFWLLPLIVGGAPTLSPREPDRIAIVSGAADRYWVEIKKKIPVDAIVVPALAPNIQHGFWSLPQSAIASYLYGALFRVKTPFFYSPTRVQYIRPAGGKFNGFGLLQAPPFLPQDVAEFPDWMKNDPKIRVLRAVNAVPFRVELLNPSGGTVEDVTPIWEKALRDSNVFAP